MSNESSLPQWLHQACAELYEPVARVASEDVDALVDALCSARRIAVHGVGREGLMMRALTMRLYHLGLDAHPVGDMTTPAVGPSDWLVASAGPGRFATVEALIGVAESSGARTALFTGNADSPLRGRATRSIVLAARTMGSVPDGGAALAMGSAYEGALFLFCEYLVERIRKRLQVSEQAMRRNHTNLE